MLYTLVIVGIATTMLVSAKTFTNQISLPIHPNSFVNEMAKYELYAILVGVLTTFAILLINPESKQLIGIGSINNIAVREKWLGINGKSSWWVTGSQLMFFISLATGTFMWLALKHTGSLNYFQCGFIPWILIFSFTNSLAEELIYRFGVVGGLSNHYHQRIITTISAILFGLPHYYGFPSGMIGVVMAGLLGYILCKASLETKGILVAWLIHFVQDIIIFSAIMMMNAKQNI
jgi:hypothetical protein